MMYRELYDAIKKIFVSTITDADLPGFLAAPLDEKVTIVKELIEESDSPYVYEAGEPEARCYVLIMHLAMQLVAPDSPEWYALKEALKIPVVTKWPKENPPVTDFALFSSNHQPPWTEEVMKLSTAARYLSFENVSNFEEVLVAAKTALEIGGMEDLGDSRCLPKTDPTLELAVRYVQYTIMTVRPEWCSPGGQLLKVLPTGGDPRPKYVQEIEMKMKEDARRADQRKEAKAKRQEALQKEYEARKVALFELVKVCDISAFITSCAAMDFDAFKEFSKDNPEQKTWLPDVLLTTVSEHIPMEPLPEDKAVAAAIIQEKIHLIEQYVFTKILAIKPDWFRATKNKDLVLRKGVGSIAYNRVELATRRGLIKIWDKYGALELAKAVLDVYGVLKPVEDVFGTTLPKKSCVVLDEEETTPAPAPAVTEPIAPDTTVEKVA